MALQNLLVISPHLDDAVLSCGEVIAAARHAVVATVFAGVPRMVDMQTAWDAASGFSSAREAIATRRTEDSRALALLHAIPAWLDFCDSQYEEATDMGLLAAALRGVLRQHEPATVLLPAGLFHADHETVHHAALSLSRDDAGRDWLIYEDVPYRRIDGLLQQRLAALSDAGVCATPVVIDTRKYAEIKRDAVRMYASQLRALATPGRPGHGDLAAPERYWRLAPRPEAS